jgi:hypothetical protein
MALKKVIEIDVDVLNAQGGIASLGKTFEDVEKNTKSLKAQLREAIAEVQQMNEKFGETSKEAINAAKRAAELKDKIEDANDAVQAFKGEGTFLATSKALSSVASGFGAVQGAMGLIGVESKDVQEQLLKVQSAMAVADGLAGLEDAGRSFKQLATVAKSYTIVQKAVTAAQWLWNAAMSANPIGAIVVVVTALIAAGYALVKMFMDSSEATKKAEKANIELNKSLDNQVKAQKKANQETELSSDHQLKMAKASGKSADEIRKLSVELANQEVAQKYANAQTLRAIAIEALRVAGLEDATEAQKETAKKALEAFNKANDDLKTSILNRRKLILDNRVAERQEQTDAEKKANEEAIKNREKANEEDLKRKTEARKKELDAINEQAKTIEENSRKLAEEKLKKDAELKKKADEILKQIDAELAPEETPTQKLQREYEERLKILTDAGASTLALDAKYATDKLQLEAKLAAEQKAIEDKKKADKDILRQQEIESVRSTFAIISDILGKQSKVGKAFALAQALINTYQGITAGVKLGYPAAIPAVIAASTTGFKAVKDILKTEPQKGGGISTSISAPSGGGDAGGASAPTFNVVGNAGVNQIATTLGKEQPPVQAYVVAGQVTTQQAMNRNIVNNATL